MLTFALRPRGGRKRWTTCSWPTRPCAVWCCPHRCLPTCGGEMGCRWSTRYALHDTMISKDFRFVQLKQPCLVSPVQVYYYQDVKCRDEMYDKDVLMLQVGGSQTSHILRRSPCSWMNPNVFTDRHNQNGPQSLPHVDPVEIRALRLLQRQLLQQRPGI